ncbi:MAG: LUD domain-containing protein [Minwuia sp.]|nr:LUD domain-containing protein [Minwuia sp.]
MAKIAAANQDNPLRRPAGELVERIANPRRNLIPARAGGPEPERYALFLEKCRELAVTIDEIATDAAAPAAIADYLKGLNLPGRLKLSPSPEITDLPWDQAPLLEVTSGAAEITDQTGVTPAFAGIAETGTLVFVSGKETPPTLNFVPDNHIVVMRRSQVMRAMEDAFSAARERFGTGVMPRALNLVSGPSRTGDVEQKIVMGAHGPRRLHILMIDDVTDD